MQNKFICFRGLDLASFATEPHGFSLFGFWKLT